MYRRIKIQFFRTSLLFCVLFLFACTTKAPILKKYGWNKFENNSSISNFIEDELCYKPEGHYDDKIWYVSSKKDYLICDKPSRFEDFCRGYTICYNMDSYYATPFRGWKGDWEKSRPDKQSKEQRIKDEQRGFELFGVKSCGQRKKEKSENT